ncbi:HAD family hydrolase [Lactiplantibacillus garii]|uniref:HAD family hydrolase n=1 Tax=Lactiplantibacillus garii TaxID=2306423 RepID=A0A426DA30_9LACO|nr:Cof-type HAD-IIB family hydrolase [Lactiplantibacillus garii]RRK11422.1 HAD family hydrolase [Lactiplantibacillus garii]
MSIKLIATDLNGTLLRADQSFDHARFKRVLTGLNQLNIPLVLSSGNQYAHLKQLFADVLADNLVMVAENGASIYARGRQVFDGSLSAEQHHHFVTVDRFQEMFKHAYLILVGSHGSYTEAGAPEQLVAMARKFYDNLQLVDDLAAVKDSIKKISVSTQPGDAAALVDQINAYFAGKLRAHDSGYGVVDIVDQHVGKLPAVQLLAAQRGLTADEVMAFGDGANDVPLLRYATHSYAMVNAPTAVQAAARHVTTLDNEHDGVLATIEHILLT